MEASGWGSEAVHAGVHAALSGEEGRMTNLDRRLGWLEGHKYAQQEVEHQRQVRRGREIRAVLRRAPRFGRKKYGS